MIRWPRDALIFSVRVRGVGVYAAGYVEGDTNKPELLGARATHAGLALVDVREQVPSWKDLYAVQALDDLRVPGVVRVLDAFVPLAALQPDNPSSLLSPSKLVVVEDLPADVHAADLVRRLFRDARRDKHGAPPVGLALRVVRELAAILAGAPLIPADVGSLRLTRRLENVLLGWDGRVHVQPRLVADGDGDDGGVVDCGRHLLRLLTGELNEVEAGASEWSRRDVAEQTDRRVAALAQSSPRVAALVDACVAGGPLFHDARSPAALVSALDAELEHEPFDRADLAGFLAQVFDDERAQDEAFREELAACDLDALTLPEVGWLDASFESLPTPT